MILHHLLIQHLWYTSLMVGSWVSVECLQVLLLTAGPSDQQLCSQQIDMRDVLMLSTVQQQKLLGCFFCKWAVFKHLSNSITGPSQTGKRVLRSSVMWTARNLKLETHLTSAPLIKFLSAFGKLPEIHYQFHGLFDIEGQLDCVLFYEMLNLLSLCCLVVVAYLTNHCDVVHELNGGIGCMDGQSHQSIGSIEQDSAHQVVQAASLRSVSQKVHCPECFGEVKVGYFVDQLRGEDDVECSTVITEQHPDVCILLVQVGESLMLLLYQKIPNITYKNTYRNTYVRLLMIL